MFSAINFPEGTKEENLARAKELIVSHNVAGALEIYNRWLLYLTKDLDLLKARAKAHLESKQMAEAQKDLDRIKAVEAERLILETKERLEQIQRMIQANSDEQYNENTRREICKACFKIGLAYAKLGETKPAIDFLYAAANSDTHFFPYDGEVKPENIVTDKEREEAFRYLQRNVEHKEELVVDHNAAIVRYSTKTIQFPELSVVYKIRAIVYKNLGLYHKALLDIILSNWMNEAPANKHDNVIILFFELRRLLRDIYIDILEAHHAFEIQREILFRDQVFRDQGCNPGHLKLSRRQWTHNFCKEIFNKCNAILSKKKHDLKLDDDIKAINFLAHVFKKIPTMAVNDVKQEEMDAFTFKHFQEWFRKLVKAYRVKNRFLDVVKLYKQVLETWPDDAAFQKGLKAAEMEADPSFNDEEVPLEQKEEAAPAANLPKAKEPKAAVVYQENSEDKFKGTGALVIQELMQEKAKKEDQARVARNQRNKKRAKQRKPALSRREAQSLAEEQEEKEEHEAELRWQQQEEVKLKQQADRDRQIAEENEQRQKTLDNFKEGIDKRQALYEKQRKEFEARQAEKKAATVVARIKINPDEWMLLDTLENAGTDVKAELYGGAIRTRAFQLFGLELDDSINDIDAKTTLPSDQILQSLKPFNVQTVSFKDEKGISKVREDFFEVKSFKLGENNQVKFLNMQVSHKPHKGYLAEAKDLDFTINTLTANKFGELHDPTGLGLLHIKNRILATVNPSSAESFAQDPSRTLRGGFYKYKYKLTTDDELMVNMEKFADQIPTMKEVFRIHSWMKSHFSYEFVSSTDAVENFKFLKHSFQNPKTKNEWNFLSKLFSPEAAKKILKSEAWVCDQLRQGAKTVAEIYMIFYVAIAMNTDGYLLDPVGSKKAIFAENPLLSDALGRPGFRFAYEKYLQRLPRPQPIPFQFYRPNPVMGFVGMTQGSVGDIRRQFLSC